jgi:hypothetical protein
MKPTQEEIATFDAAMKAFNKIHVKRTTEEIGEYLGIPKDYNWDKKDTKPYQG